MLRAMARGLCERASDRVMRAQTSQVVRVLFAEASRAAGGGLGEPTLALSTLKKAIRSIRGISRAPSTPRCESSTAAHPPSPADYTIEGPSGGDGEAIPPQYSQLASEPSCPEISTMETPPTPESSARSAANTHRELLPRG